MGEKMLEDMHIFNAAEATKTESNMFTFEVDYSTREGYNGPRDFEKVFVKLPVGCLGEIVVLGKVWSSMPLYGEDGYTIGIQIVKVALADAADLKKITPMA